MRKFLFLLFAIASLSCAGQSKVKVYAFSQGVIPAVNSGGTTVEGSTEVNTMEARTNYFIYVSAPGRIYPSEIWVDGEPYSVSTTRVNKTPVTRTNAEGNNVVLVPKTTSNVWAITLAPPIQSKLSSKGRQLSANNEVVLVYRMNGKFYQSVVKRMNQLDAAPMQ